MGKKILIPFLWVVGMIWAGTIQAGSFFHDRSGIGVRGAYWSLRNEDTMVRVTTHGFNRSEVDVGGAGGWLSFYSGIGNRLGIEFSLGGVGRAEVNEDGLFTNEVQVSGAMPVLIGIQYPLFSERNISSFQPYLSAGGGPYILSRVQVHDETFLDDEVSVKNRIRTGVYGAAGGYFLLASWFALQGEMRYHLVNFNPDDSYSGFELGLGLAFFWKR